MEAIAWCSGVERVMGLVLVVVSDGRVHASVELGAKERWS